MVKSLKRYQVQITPFEAAKNWALNNVDNNDLLLFESTGSDDGEPLDLEFIDYGDGVTTPFTSSECEIALEQQPDDKVGFRDGMNIVGSFYSDTDPVNVDGTYKRTVYCQVRTTFYNDYRNVTQLWGVENIDFENSKTKRRLTDKLRMYDIPRSVYGDKIVPNSVKIYDTSLDNDYIIADDGNGNLFAEKNLFSKQQELGDFANEFQTGSNDDCCVYFGNCPSGSVTTTTTTTTTPTTTTTTTTTPAPLCDCSEWSEVEYICTCGVSISQASPRSVCGAITNLLAGIGEAGPYLECWCTTCNLDSIIAYVASCHPERTFHKVTTVDIEECTHIGVVRDT